MLVYENEDDIRKLKPDLSRVAGLDCFAVIVTAPGKKSDFVSRFFAPGAGIPEDPVTGSAHSTLIPFWSERTREEETACAPAFGAGRGTVLRRQGGAGIDRREGGNVSFRNY